MAAVKMVLNSFIFWGGWIIIPFLMEIVPALGSVFLLLKRHARYKAKQGTLQMYPEISIIVPVYNSADTLFACIASINDSTYPNESIRVFLVNNKGQDNSFEVYAECQRKFPKLRMQWMNAEQGKSRALNLALYNSEGKYIINLDSDGVLEKTALANLIYKFEMNTELNCMTGAILTAPELIKQYKGFFARTLRNLEFMEYAQAFLAGRSYASEMNSVYTLSGAFSAFRKSAVLKSWMYNTDTICEDTHITFQMRYRQNERVEICEDAIFFVDPIEDVNKLYTQRQRWQRGSLEVAQMFMGKRFKVKNMFKDVNVKTLLYDHTFAFPRMIWYLALICLMAMGYSGKVILISTGLIFAMYTFIGYFYFATVIHFLKITPDVRRYYVTHWWCILLLPFFNFAVFFIRMAGIINSIQTDSSWKTRNLTEERNAFVHIIEEDFSKPLHGLRQLRRVVNNKPTYRRIPVGEQLTEVDLEEVDTHKTAASDKNAAYVKKNREKTERTRTTHLKVKKSGVSIVWYICVSLFYLISIGMIYGCRWLRTHSNMGTAQMLREILNQTQDGQMLIRQGLQALIIPIVILMVVFIILGIIDYIVSRKLHGKGYDILHDVVGVGSTIAVVAAVFYVNYTWNLLGYIQGVL